MGISWILLIRAVSITMKFLALASSLLAAVSGQYLGYAGYPYAAHAIVGLKSAPCVNAANVPVPCAAGYYGKIIIIQIQYSYSIQYSVQFHSDKNTKMYY